MIEMKNTISENKQKKASLDLTCCWGWQRKESMNSKTFQQILPNMITEKKQTGKIKNRTMQG